MGNALYKCVRSPVSIFKKIRLLPKIGVFAAAALMMIFLGYAGSGAAGPNSGVDPSAARSNVAGQKSMLLFPSDYVVIGWNDLGMHCINPDYATLALLPPFNNLWVQVIKRGDPPKIVTSGIKLDYAIVNNTTVTGKTDFWKNGAALYANLLGIPTPAAGVGLTGNRLAGSLAPAGDHFEATGIPVLPYDDKKNWNPFQVATVKLKNKFGMTLANTQVVLPVSDEIHCDMCHMQGGDGTANLPVDPATGMTGTMDTNMNILLVHDYYNGALNLAQKKPVLCATCHSSNALGAPGTPGTKSVSLAMHGWHNGVDRAPDATCYSCHPGAVTQCLRTAIGGMGYLGKVPSCQTGQCHGGIAGITKEGRNPWVDEPNCEQCHGSNYSTNGTLFRKAKGHGGVYCAACHNSPHAWWPSKQWSDNMQPMSLTKRPYSIGKCSTCHTKPKYGDNPHVVYYFGE